MGEYIILLLISSGLKNQKRASSKLFYTARCEARQASALIHTYAMPSTGLSALTDSGLKDIPLLLITLVAPIIYCVLLVVYRLFFHPLRHIPGPRLAAVTYWYEFYEDVVLNGHFIYSSPVLHAKYGRSWAPGLLFAEALKSELLRQGPS